MGMFIRNELIDKIAVDAIANGSAVGCSCLVFKDGKELYSGAFGFSDRESGAPMKRDSIVRLFSLTKPVTAVAAMILIDRGLLSPDDPVSKFFPEYERLSYVSETGEVLPCWNVMTVLHLLTMTSGLPYANNYNPSVRASAKLFDAVISGQHGGEPVSTVEFARRAAAIPLMFQPGQRWDYGISADVLGGIIERVSGMSYGEFLRRNIFAPLGMDDTGFYVPPEKLERLTTLYSWTLNGLQPDRSNYLGLTDFTAPPAFESGGAGLCSTIDDYSKFARMLANRGVLGSVRILSEKAFSFMTSPRLAGRKGLWDVLAGYDYGCLVRVMTDPDSAMVRTAAGEFGWDGWTGTYFCADPENKLTVLYFTQISGAGTTRQARDITRLVYEVLAEATE